MRFRNCLREGGGRCNEPEKPPPEGEAKLVSVGLDLGQCLRFRSCLGGGGGGRCNEPEKPPPEGEAKLMSLSSNLCQMFDISHLREGGWGDNEPEKPSRAVIRGRNP